MRSDQLANEIAQLTLSKKAERIIIMDVRGITSITDYFVVCSASSDKQVKAIAEAVVDGLDEKNIKPWHKEGFDSLRWILLDYIDVVVHIFYEEAREHYALERLWGDAKIIEIHDDEDAAERKDIS